MRHEKYVRVALLSILLGFNLLFIKTSGDFALAQTETENSEVTSTSPGKVTAGESSVIDLLCTPDTENASDISGCINKIVRTGIVVSMFAAVGMIIWAGYYYMSGDQSKMSKAKKMIMGTGAGLIIIMFTFLILKLVNPSTLETPQLTVDIDTSMITCKISEQGAKCIEPPKLETKFMAGNTNISYDQNGNAVGQKSAKCKGELVTMSSQGLKVQTNSDKACSSVIPQMKQIQDAINASVPPNTPWRITDAYDSTGKAHVGVCHLKEGTCFDIGVEPSSKQATDPDIWNKICTSIQSIPNTRIINEVVKGPVYQKNTACGQSRQTQKGYGNHVHVYILDP